MFTRLIGDGRRSHAPVSARPRSTRAARVLMSALPLALALSALVPATGSAFAPPALHVSGERLVWSKSGTRNTYKLLIKLPGDQSITTVVGRSVTPPAAPGASVTYRVKAAFNQSAWSNAVTIAYPGGKEEEPPHEKEEPPHEKEEPPHEEEASSASEGEVKYRLDAASYFDPFAVPQYIHWAQQHVAMIKGYAPFGDIYLALFGLPLLGYHDPATGGQAPLNPAGIEAYVEMVQRDMSLGYTGVFIDDANWSPGFKPSPGPPAHLASLIEAVHAAEPNALIEMNSQFHDIWPLMKAGNPDVTRALQYVDIMTKEFGVGPTSGINTGQDYREYFEYVEALHAKGIDVTMTGDQNANDVPTMEYNLATYFLINDGGDFINGHEQTPRNWWSGFDVKLGKPVGDRQRSPSGLWSRLFSGGAVYTVEPGAPTQTVRLPRLMHSAEWGNVSSVTLSAGQGAVLVG